jgi:hypothetical protein
MIGYSPYAETFHGEKDPKTLDILKEKEMS